MSISEKHPEQTEFGVTGTSAALHEAAVRRLHRRQEFHSHLAAYLIVNGLLIATWLVLAFTVGFWFPWPLFPVAGWGIGLAMHAYETYGPPSRPITDEAIEQEMRRLAGR